MIIKLYGSQLIDNITLRMLGDELVDCRGEKIIIKLDLKAFLAEMGFCFNQKRQQNFNIKTREYMKKFILQLSTDKSTRNQ